MVGLSASLPRGGGAVGGRGGGAKALITGEITFPRALSQPLITSRGFDKRLTCIFLPPSRALSRSSPLLPFSLPSRVLCLCIFDVSSLPRAITIIVVRTAHASLLIAVFFLFQIFILIVIILVFRVVYLFLLVLLLPIVFILISFTSSIYFR